MSEPAISGESYGGWLRLAWGIGFAFVLPIWLLLAAGFLQAKPFEAVLEADQNGTIVTVQTPLIVRLAQAIFESGLWVALLLGSVAMMAMLWALLDRRQRGQSIQLRQGYADQSPATFQLDATDWRVEVVDRGSEDGYDGDADGESTRASIPQAPVP